MVGPTARPTIAFDRVAGPSPVRHPHRRRAPLRHPHLPQGKTTFEPRSAFTTHTFTDNAGVDHDYLLADRNVRIRWVDKNKKRRLFACRQITRLDPATATNPDHPSRTDPDPALIAHAMFEMAARDFFRYMRAHYGLDALDAYDTVGDNPERLVTNPARKQADKQVAAAPPNSPPLRPPKAEPRSTEASADQKTRRRVPAAQAHIDHSPPPPATPPPRSASATSAPTPPDSTPNATHPRRRTHRHLQRRVRPRPNAHHPLPAQQRRSPQPHPRNRPHRRRLQIPAPNSHPHPPPLPPRRTRALQALCHDLNQTDTTYPGTNLTLRYSTHPHP